MSFKNEDSSGTGATKIQYAGDPNTPYGPTEELMQYMAGLAQQSGARRDSLLYGSKGARTGTQPGSIFWKYGTMGGNAGDLQIDPITGKPLPKGGSRAPNEQLPPQPGTKPPENQGGNVTAQKPPTGMVVAPPGPGGSPDYVPATGGVSAAAGAVTPNVKAGDNNDTGSGGGVGHLPITGGGGAIGGGGGTGGGGTGGGGTGGGGHLPVGTVHPVANPLPNQHPLPGPNPNSQQPGTPGYQGPTGALDYTAGAPEGILGQYENWRNSSGFDPETLSAIQQQTSAAARGAGDSAIADMSRRFSGTGNAAGYYAGRGAVGGGQAQALTDAAQKTAIANYTEKQRLHELGTAGEQGLYNSDTQDMNNYLAQLAQLTGRKRGVISNTEAGSSGGGIDFGQLLRGSLLG